MKKTKTVPTTPAGMDSYIRLSTLTQIVGRSAMSIYRDEKAGRFPKRRRIGPNAVAWLRSEVEDWMTKRDAA